MQGITPAETPNEGPAKTRVWADYIARLNDRAPARKQASGFTTWAVCGLLVLLFYHQLDRVAAIAASTNAFTSFVMLFTNVFNLLCAFGVVIVALMLPALQYDTLRLSVPLDRHVGRVMHVPLWGLILLLIAVNFYSATIARAVNLSRWPYYTFAIIFALQVIGVLFTYLFLRYMLRAHASKAPFSAVPLMPTQPTRRFFLTIISAVYAIALLLAASVAAFQNVHANKLLDQPDLIKLAFELSAFIFLLLYASTCVSRFLYERFLATLEQRIVMERLTDDQIKQIFVREYLGETIREWFDSIEVEIDAAYEPLIQRLTAAQSEMASIRDIDTQYSIEIEGRRSKVCDSVRSLRQAYAAILKTKIAYIRHLNGQRVFSGPDSVRLDQLIEIRVREFQAIEQAYAQLCQTCGQAKCDTKNARALPPPDSLAK